MNSNIVTPFKRYESVEGVLPLYSTARTWAVGTNHQIVAAVSGKVIAVMGIIAQTNAASPLKSVVELIDGSGGTAITIPLSVATDLEDPTQFPVDDNEYCRTSTGIGLYANVTVARVGLWVRYIVYTPDL